MRSYYINFIQKTNFLRLLCIAAFMVAIGMQTSSATHLAGGNITYTCLGNNQYRIVASIYRDCKGIALSNSISLTMSSSCGSQTVTATVVPGFPRVVNPPCPGQRTACDVPAGPAPGIQRWDYQYTATLTPCADWTFSFSLSARNNAITTIPSAGSYNLYLETHKKDLGITCNNSIQFNNDPILFVCVGQQFCFNAGVTDPDADSVSYAFVCPRSAANTCLPYNSGYSPTQPIAGPITLDPVTGVVCMTPSKVEVGVMAYIIYEYRRINNVMTQVGSVIRDIQIYTQQCTNNIPSITGIDSTSSTVLNLCGGASKCFKIYANDVDVNDTLSLTYTPTGSIPVVYTADTTTLGRKRPIANLCVTTTAADIGKTFNFSIFAKDNACPSYGSFFKNFSIVVGGLQATTSSTPTSCNGGNNGSATVSVTNGSGTYQYLWTPSLATTQTATNLYAGSYSVLITDASGCTGTQTVTVTQPSALSVSLTNVLQPTCNSLGSFSILAGGGTPNYTYFTNTSPSQTTPNVSNVPAGTYAVTVRDSKGCRASTTLTFSGGGALTYVGQSQIDVKCNGGNDGTATILVSGGTGNYVYNWTPSVSTDATAAGLTAGTYTVTASDNNNCTASGSFVITEPTALSVSETHADVKCNAGNDGNINIIASGGTGSYNYTWTPNVSNNSSASGLNASTYTIITTDANQCSVSQTVTISEPTALALSEIHADVKCNGGSDGNINLTVSGGSGGYLYVWTGNISSTASASNLSTGNYGVTVTDANGCIVTTVVSISEPTALAANESHTDVSCNGGSDATINLSVSGGSGNYTFTWFPNVSSTSSASNLTSGTYNVTTTDANGCIVIETIIINEPTAIVVTETHTDPLSCVCTGPISGGTINISASGGTGVLTYTWVPNVSNSSSASNLNAGTYVITIKDENNCTATLTVTLNAPVPLAITITHTDVTCEGGNDGSATANVSGGLPPYSYLWLPTSNTSQTVSNISAGWYAVRVKDSLGCSIFNSVRIGFQHQQPVLDLGSDATACVGKTYTIDAGAGYSSYVWSDNSSNQTLVVTSTGSYSVTVTDAFGCTNTDAINVNFVNCALGSHSSDNVRLENVAHGISAMVYPNPANNVVNVAITGIKEGVNISIELSDILGNKIHSLSETSVSDYLQTVSLNKLPQGIYMLKVQYGDHVKTVKIVKE